MYRAAAGQRSPLFRGSALSVESQGVGEEKVEPAGGGQRVEAGGQAGVDGGGPC